MPSSRSSRTSRPVIVEVKPSDVGGTNMAPCTPPDSPNTKKARFASTVVDGYTRPWNYAEQCSLYNFEKHARGCRVCTDPLKVYMRRDSLCPTGYPLSLDVAEHVYLRAGEVCSKAKEDHKLVRVEINPNYTQTMQLLQAMDRDLRSRSRTVPMVSYDRTYPVPSRRRSSPERRDEGREERREERRERERKYDEDRYEKVTVEPASNLSRHKSSHKSKRYSTVVVDEDVEASTTRQPEQKPESRKGSLYDAEIARQKRDKGYVVEVREPSSTARDREREERRKQERRRSGYYY